ncbi:MAG: thiamine diphosphokinase [Spirochaetaceae bacterium]|nr:thiamine diphosphokinase [Spirochaetaceae bacterium]
MKLAIIITGGNAPLFIPETVPLDNAFIVAADSGLDVAEILGLKCDIAIGDFDSIKDTSLLTDLEVLKYPKDKDYSDTELAISLVKDRGYDDYVLIGGGEGRMDHLLNIWTLFKKLGPPICWITRKEAMYLVKDKRRFKTAKGEIVSFIPTCLNSESVVNAKELKWPLDNFDINISKMSLSNEATKGNLIVETIKGSVYTVFLNPRENHW